MLSAQCNLDVLPVSGYPYGATHVWGYPYGAVRAYGYPYGYPVVTLIIDIMDTPTRAPVLPRAWTQVLFRCYTTGTYMYSLLSGDSHG